MHQLCEYRRYEMMKLAISQLTYVMLLQSGVNIWQVAGYQVSQDSLISLHQQHNIAKTRGHSEEHIPLVSH